MRLTSSSRQRNPARAPKGCSKSLEAQDALGSPQDIDLILDYSGQADRGTGRTKMTIKELLRLSQGSVVALDGLAGEPLDILINGYLIAQGEVVVVADNSACASPTLSPPSGTHASTEPLMTVAAPVTVQSSQSPPRRPCRPVRC